MEHKGNSQEEERKVGKRNYKKVDNESLNANRKVFRKKCAAWYESKSKIQFT
jgi:hypothetical protein